MPEMETSTHDTRLPEVFCIGDSISLDYGPYLQALLAGTFRYARKGGEEEARENLDIPRGANGGDSSRVRAYLQGLADDGAFRTDILLLNCGLHDLKTDPASGAKQVPPDAYEENLHAIAHLARRMAGAVVWVRTTPIEEAIHNELHQGFHRFAEDVHRYNAVADRVMADADIPRIDLHGCTRALGDGVAVFRDHAHFHPAVAQAQAAFLAGWLHAWFAPDGSAGTHAS